MRPHLRWWPRPQRIGVTLVALVGSAVLLLGTTLGIAGLMLGQSRALDRNVAVTTQIVNANVRTLSQVQRELLRLESALVRPGTPGRTIEMHRAFVSQRMSEASLSYQLNTLGTEELLSRARALARSWQTDVDPAIRAMVADQSGEVTASSALIDQIERLELGFNELVAQGEINRKMQAGRANAVTVDLLHNARRLVVGLLVTFGGFFGLVVVAVVVYRRFDRQREAARRRLLQLNAEARKLSEVASRTGNLVVICDAAGQIEWVNEAFEAVTGFTLDEAVGRRPGDLLQTPETDPETIEMMRRHIRNGEGFTCEVLNRSKAGRDYWVSIEVCAVHDEDGRVTNFIAVESDVTEARESAEHLRLAKEAAEGLAEEKAQFLASMSHEIRTPLNAVIGLTDLLLGTELSPVQREYVQTAHKSGTLLLSTVSNILSFSAAEAGRIELERRPFSLRQLVDRSVSTLHAIAEEKDLSLGVVMDGEVPDIVVGDETRLQQVLVNLVGNAIKFTEQGRVDVRVSSPGSASALIPVRFTVADTGIGIPTDRLDRLFQPFTQCDTSTTRRYGGSGLGLAISQRLIALLGGHIDVVSVVGEGSTFTFEVDLPIADASAMLDGVSTMGERSEAAAPVRLRVLLAEDDGVNQMVAVHMLERLGHFVKVVDDGVAALEALRDERFDVLLLDVQMPRLDGVSVARQVRADRPLEERPVIIALTANALDGDRERFLAAGMDGYLSKPFRLEQLDAVLRSSVNDRRAALPGLR